MNNNSEFMPVECLNVPKVLFYDKQYEDLSMDAKLIYALLLDRKEMAIRNEWVDEYGDTYVIYPKQEMKKYLNISRYRIDQALAELEEHDQMVEVTVQGLHLPGHAGQGQGPRPDLQPLLGRRPRGGEGLLRPGHRLHPHEQFPARQPGAAQINHIIKRPICVQSADRSFFSWTNMFLCKNIILVKTFSFPCSTAAKVNVFKPFHPSSHNEI